MKSLSIVISLFLYSSLASATIWSVGPTRTYTFCSQIVSLVQDGDTVEIDFATYINDSQVQWNQNNIYIIGIGGTPRLQAGNIIASDPTNGKGIFVLMGSDVRIHNIEFANAMVISNNGAGIRHQGGNLTVTHCRFVGNQNGILSGNHTNTTVRVEHCQFRNSGNTSNPGFQHNIYVNHIDSFVFRFNYSIDAIGQGHELKSRADYNFIEYNRISSHQSADSRNIDLSNGGTAVIVGNIFEQGQASVNSNILGYGLEGLINFVPHKLFCTNNTFVNKKSTGSFVQVAFGTDTVVLKNNIMVGAKTGGLILGAFAYLDSSNNFINNSVSAAGFINDVMYDYHLSSASPAIDNGTLISRSIYGHPLQPNKMYKDSSQFEPRPVFGSGVDIGAFEYTVVSAPELELHSSIDIFPNPTTGNIFINSFKDEIRFITVMDLSGKIMFNYKTTGLKHTIDLSSCQSGVYIIDVYYDHEVSHNTIVLQKN